MSTGHRISVVIPTRNEAHEITATLESVAGALGPEAEILVVDGGSTDGTPTIAARHARVLHTAAGRGRQLRTGARAARGDVLLFLHADTWLDPTAERAIARALGRDEVVGGCFRIRLRGPTSRRPLAAALTAAINLRTRLFRSASGDQAIFLRRTAYDAIGGVPPVELFEDVILFRKLRKLGEVVILDPPVRTSDRRWREEGYGRTILRHLWLRVLFWLGVPTRHLARIYDGAL